jgi:acyl-homoserine-lactone acylase
MKGREHMRRGLLLVLALPAWSSCLGDSPYAKYRYEATIRRTSWGVAHIEAKDFGSAGFGQAYAFAQDHACVLADQIVKVRSERAMFFGPDKIDEGDGEHLNSDFAYKHLDVMARAETALAAQSDDVRAIIEGYAAGYNQYLADTGAEHVPGSCQGAAWLRPISATDLVAYYVDLGMLAGSWQLVQYMATAQPPGRAQLAGPRDGMAALNRLRGSGLGSNGWAVGKERTESGHGMVVANPHFPWEGELKLWESHITVPGQLNIYGVGLMGVPGSLIGFNEHVAWAHTFSSGQRFTIYALDLVEGDPTSYVYDGEPRKMYSKEYTVDVKQADGSLKEVTRTLWASHYGPIIGLDPFTWGNLDQAMTYRDANIDNVKLIEQFSGMNRATSLEEFKAVYEEVGGIPWVNTMAADREGHAWYIDASATPRLRQSAIDRWLVAIEDDFVASALYAQAGVVALDGGDPDNEWTEAPGARSPGLVPYSELPQIDRADFVFNANDSFWLANPASPLEGYSPLHGFERVPQSPRTRMNMVLLTEEGADGASGEDGKFTVPELQAAIMGNRSMTADLLRDEVVARCEGAGPVTVVVEKEERTVAIDEACAVLAAWDGRFDPDSVGAIVWRELLGNYTDASLEDYGVLLAQGFDPDDPIGTPHTLKPAPDEGDDPLLASLGKAVVQLDAAGLAVDAPLKAAQFAYRGGKRFAVPGGQNRDGTANVVNYGVLKSTVEPGTPLGTVVGGTTELTDHGYVVNYGTSFVMAVELTDEGPQGFGFLSYSQSDDPKSKHYRDQTPLFAGKEWRPLVFSEADIAADPELTTVAIGGGGPPAEAE